MALQPTMSCKQGVTHVLPRACCRADVQNAAQETLCADLEAGRAARKAAAVPDGASGIYDRARETRSRLCVRSARRWRGTAERTWADRVADGECEGSARARRGRSVFQER